MTYKIPVKVYYSDGGDGSGTFTAYNSLDELKEGEDFDDEKLQEILDEEDSYENGEIDEETIEIEIVDGQPRLAKPFSLHWGQ